MQVTMNVTTMGESGTLLTAGQSYAVSESFGASLVGRGAAVDARTFPVVNGMLTASTSFTLAAADDGKVFNVTTAITVTIPNGLSPRPNVAFVPPPTGNLSIAVTGGANINGAATTLTRARSANPAGFVVTPYTESDGYGVSGS